MHYLEKKKKGLLFKYLDNPEPLVNSDSQCYPLLNKVKIIKENCEKVKKVEKILISSNLQFMPSWKNIAALSKIRCSETVY